MKSREEIMKLVKAEIELVKGDGQGDAPAELLEATAEVILDIRDSLAILAHAASKVAEKVEKE